MKNNRTSVKYKLMLTVFFMLIFSVSFGEEHPDLTVVFMSGLEPLCWEENGKPMGEQPEITQYVLSKLGIKAKFLFLPWARAQKMIEDGTADLMMAMPSKARFKFSVFGKEMTSPNYWNIFISKDNARMMKNAKNLNKIETLHYT
jgi:hypothetical protein